MYVPPERKYPTTTRLCEKTPISIPYLYRPIHPPFLPITPLPIRRQPVHIPILPSRNLNPRPNMRHPRMASQHLLLSLHEPVMVNFQCSREWPPITPVIFHVHRDTPRTLARVRTDRVRGWLRGFHSTLWSGRATEIAEAGEDFELGGHGGLD